LHIASLPVPPAPLKRQHYGALQMYNNNNKQQQQQKQWPINSGWTHPGSPWSFNTSHDATDVLTEELFDAAVIGHLQHVKNNVLQCRPTLLIGQSTLRVVIETKRCVQWRLLLVQA